MRCWVACYLELKGMKLFWNYNSSFFTREKGYPLTVESHYQPPDTYLTIPSKATTMGFFFNFVRYVMESGVWTE
jgi:hypothetical protein